MISLDFEMVMDSSWPRSASSARPVSGIRETSQLHTGAFSTAKAMEILSISELRELVGVVKNCWFPQYNCNMINTYVYIYINIHR